MGEKCEKEKCMCKGNSGTSCAQGQGGTDMGAKTREYGESAKQGAGHAGEHAKGTGEDVKNKAKGVDLNKTYEHGKEMAHKAGEKTKSGATSAYHKTKEMMGKTHDKVNDTGKKDGQ